MFTLPSHSSKLISHGYCATKYQAHAHLNCGKHPSLQTTWFFRETPFSFQINPTQVESMLHKVTIMTLVVTNVIMNLLKNFATMRVYWVKSWVHYVGDMHQNIDLKIIPMHVLHLTLCLECIIF
jgi:hypothetical protein